MGHFAYLLEKIENAEFSHGPFKHIEIQDFFHPSDFREITQAPEVSLEPASSDEDLINKLHKVGFKEIVFPGTTTDLREYLRWHRAPEATRNSNQETCEGVGITFRLQEARGILSDIDTFFRSPEFISTIAKKFSIEIAEVYPDMGLQKYLDGYEISPHPDIRKKALTYMINVNPAAESESLNYHTHYMKFLPEWDYIRTYWEGNPAMDRCWVPWSWCETIKRQTKNNSIVMFSPDNDTLHAITARYDHLKTQRTQFYGNLWYHQRPCIATPCWRDFQVQPTSVLSNNDHGFANAILNRIPSYRVRTAARRLLK